MGQGSLSISGNDVKMSVDKVVGDSSGILTVRPSQTIHLRGSEGHLPFSLLSQKATNVTFPKSMNCRGVEVVLRGVMGEMSNLTVGPQCRFVLENSTETEFALDHVVVQTDGYMASLREDRKNVQIVGKTFDIRGGATVSKLNRKIVHEIVHMTFVPCSTLFLSRYRLSDESHRRNLGDINTLCARSLHTLNLVLRVLSSRGRKTEDPRN